MTQAPYYTLRQLIIRKYGPEKFAIGCAIVCSWVNGGKNSEFRRLSGSWLCYTVEHICSTTEEWGPLTVGDLEKLRQLFALESVADLFTNPDNGAPFVQKVNILKERGLI